MGPLIAVAVVVVWIIAGLLLDRHTGGDGDIFERGAIVFFGPFLVAAISPFLLLGGLAKLLNRVGKRA